MEHSIKEHITPETLLQRIQNWIQGNDEGFDQTDEFREIYQKLLRNMHTCRFRRDLHSQDTLQTGALLNEVYLRVRNSNVKFNDIDHFYNFFSLVARWIIIDYLKTKQKENRISFETLQETLQAQSQMKGTLCPKEDAESVELNNIVVYEALEKLFQVAEIQARCFVLHYQQGMSYTVIARVLQLKTDQVKYQLRLAKRWLKAYLLKTKPGV